ncbi:FkbM family methyltransferase [Solirubrobacter phytolaccae]|uniref:FkbM family methyltransferase n=1 Tax=Solirubrobacter phytolaccae TaxID=1404360 RepID=A0A9X3N8P8_9ACTN|nr:FkbM family methyltransferase [Solirubrobacter phytolaccae]MDA0180322.1 FkbM family methyltransferase [Solirubrobacter phytolaccae]
MDRAQLKRLVRDAATRTNAAARARGVEVRRVSKVFVDHPEAELRMTLEHAVAHRIMTGGPDLFVVQVGAFDGQTNDPIHEWIMRFGWRGVLVEPQARYFARLQQTYAGVEGLELRNVALAHISGQLPFYTVRQEPGVPDWAGQLATFERATILSHEHLVPNIEALIETTEVETKSFHDLLEGVEQVDLLQIDAEGFDAEIVRMFDFDRWQPSIVNFESTHLSREDHESVLRLLIDRGYRVSTTDVDTLAYRER